MTEHNPFLDISDEDWPALDASGHIVEEEEESNIGCCAWGSTYGTAGTIHRVFMDGQWEECCTFG